MNYWILCGVPVLIMIIVLLSILVAACMLSSEVTQDEATLRDKLFVFKKVKKDGCSRD